MDPNQQPQQPIIAPQPPPVQAAPPVQPVIQPEANRPLAQTPPPPPSNNLMPIIFITIVILIIGAGAFYFFTSQNASTPPTYKVQTIPTASPTPEVVSNEEKELDSIEVGTVEADFVDIEKDLQAL